MNYFYQILKYAKPYKRFAILNIVCNIFYALFSALSFVALIPMLDVLFQKDKAIPKAPLKEPTYQGLTNLKDFFQDYLSYQVNQYAANDPSKALLLVILLVIVLFLFKNLFNYLAMYFITFLRNGVLKDLRDAIFSKMTVLPLAYYSEKRKGDTIARISNDVQ